MAGHPYLWSTTSANNNTADSDINWSEGQTPGSVNNSARAMMAGVATYLEDHRAEAMLNGTLTVTANASALTIAVKTKAGSDPSASDPVFFFFRSATATTPDLSVLKVTAATSLVLSSGSTLGVTSSTAFRIWIVAFNDGGTFRLGAFQSLTGGGLNASYQVSPLDFEIASSTAEGGAGAADSAGVIYTGTAVTSKPMRILGYAEWSTSGLTAGTWTTTNLSVVQLFGPGIPRPGQIIQHKTVLSTPNDTTTSTTYVTSSCNIAITPKSAANLLCIRHSGAGYGVSENCFAQWSRGSTANTNMAGSISLVNAAGSGVTVNGALVTVLYDLPNTASSQTYTMQFKGAAGGTAGFGANVANVEEALEIMT